MGLFNPKIALIAVFCMVGHFLKDGTGVEIYVHVETFMIRLFQSTVKRERYQTS